MGDKSSLPTSAGRDIPPAAASTPVLSSTPKFSLAAYPQPLLWGTGCFFPSCSSDIFHAVSFCSSTKPRWDSLDFLTALSPACSCYQKHRSCPILALLPHQHEASLCPERSTELHAAEPQLPDPCLCAGRGETPPRGFGDLPARPPRAPPVPRQIMACPRLPFPGTRWAGMQARQAAAAMASACKVPRGQHTSQPGCPDWDRRQQHSRQSPPSPPIPQGQGALGSAMPSQSGEAFTRS